VPDNCCDVQLEWFVGDEGVAIDEIATSMNGRLAAVSDNRNLVVSLRSVFWPLSLPEFWGDCQERRRSDRGVVVERLYRCICRHVGELCL